MVEKSARVTLLTISKDLFAGRSVVVALTTSTPVSSPSTALTTVSGGDWSGTASGGVVAFWSTLLMVSKIDERSVLSRRTTRASATVSSCQRAFWSTDSEEMVFTCECSCNGSNAEQAVQSEHGLRCMREMRM